MAKSISKFIQSLRYEDIPADVRGIMRRSLLDTIGVAAIGSTTRIAAITRQFAAQHMPASEVGPRARILFSGQTASPAGAAMAGAFTIDSIDAHDGYTAVKGHAGSAALPSVLAMVDGLRQQGGQVSGRDLIVALTIAYEVAYRSGLTLHATTPDYHTSGAWTAVGVAAAGAKLLGLNEEGLRHAMGIAEYHGPRSQMMRCIDHPTMLRDGVGWGAPSGVAAAYLASLGFTGAPAITVEGVEARPFWDDLGERWEIGNTHYKAYPVCRWAHPALDAAAELMSEHRLTSADIVRARIRTFHYATRLAGHEPKTLDELSYALAYPFAIMIVRGQIGPNELTEAILTDPEILRISRATEIVDSEHYTRISTTKRWADITLYLKDGREVQSGPRAPRGDPDNPLSDRQLHDKFHSLADPVVGVARATEIEKQAAHVDDDNYDMGGLLDLICGKPDAAPGRHETFGGRPSKHFHQEER